MRCMMTRRDGLRKGWQLPGCAHGPGSAHVACFRGMVQGRLKALSLALQRRTAIVLAGLRPDNDLWV